MSEGASGGAGAWTNAALAAALFAVDPVGTGGVALRAHAGPVRDRWLALLREYLPPDAPLRRVPLHVPDGRLLGGLDLAATLRAGRPVAERGILTESDGGVVVLAMAERLEPFTAARLTAVLDTGEVALERDGLGYRHRAHFGVVALDEGTAEDEHPPGALLDRLAFHVDLGGVALRDVIGGLFDAPSIAAARARVARIDVPPAIVEALCATAMALGIASLRAPLLALRAARAAAALDGRDAVTEDDATLAGRLVLAPRATVLPPSDAPDESPGEAEQPPDAPPPPSDESEQDQTQEDRPLEDIVLDAAVAAIPTGLLAQLRLFGGPVRGSRSHGKAGMMQRSVRRGRPAGTRRGDPRTGARLNVIETLRVAAPWQPLRRRERAATAPSMRVEVRRDDFRISRFRQRTSTTTIFVVDASGSSALHRLAEAKGAVELLLADCYVRRDQVALIAFRGRDAELLLPPTRSLVRAKRSLAGLPGGGGTPLAAGIDAAIALADAVKRRGDTPTIVLLTDGRANVARDGSGGRPKAEEEAVVAARRAREAGFAILLVDTSPRPHPFAERIAAELGARYLPLPHADAARISGAVQALASTPARRSTAAP